MFCDGAKEIVSNQMHARVPNTFIKRDQWVNLCIDLGSFAEECFSSPSKKPGGTQGSLRNRSRGDSEGPRKQGQQKVENAANAYNIQSSIPQRNGFKCLEQLQIEGQFKLKKIFSVRNQIPIDPLEDELGDLVP